MPTLHAVIDGFAASREWDAATFSRLGFWDDALGERELTEITPDDVDAALVALAERGRLLPGRNRPTSRTGQPLKGSTINRYVSQLGSVYTYARRLRLIPRAFVPPTKGIERAPEPPDPERYLMPEQVERLLKVAALVDRRWGKLPALIRLLSTTGLRIGNALALRWRDVDLERRTLSVPRTKNGEPIVCAMPQKTVDALRKLPGRSPEALVFGGPTGAPYNPRRLFRRACEEAGLPQVTPHWLRHSAGYALARAGVGQAMLMQILGHKSLASSARYMHQSADDKLRIADSVFG